MKKRGPRIGVRNFNVIMKLRMFVSLERFIALLLECFPVALFFRRTRRNISLMYAVTLQSCANIFFQIPTDFLFINVWEISENSRHLASVILISISFSECNNIFV